MTRKIRIGLVAFGYSGKFFHAPFIHSNPNFDLCKVVERHNKKSKEIYPYVEVVRDFADLLNDKNIELVVITTPSHLHYEMTKEALLANKHVVVEKPFTATFDEAQELTDLAKNKNKILSVYHNRRWDGDFLTVKQVIKNKLLGKLVEYEAHFDRYTPHLNTKAWKERKEKGTGNLFDLGSHLIDQAQNLFGIPKTVTADIQTQRDVSKVDDYFELILEYDMLKVILKAGMLVREKGPHFILHGNKGSFVKYGMDPQEEALTYGLSPLSSDWGTEHPEKWGILNTQINNLRFKGKIETIPGSYEKFYDNIYDSIVNQSELAVKPEEARNTIRIIELAFESSSKKCTVTFK